jgi:hypothetical protein
VILEVAKSRPYLIVDEVERLGVKIHPGENN